MAQRYSTNCEKWTKIKESSREQAFFKQFTGAKFHTPGYWLKDDLESYDNHHEIRDQNHLTPGKRFLNIKKASCLICGGSYDVYTTHK